MSFPFFACLVGYVIVPLNKLPSGKLPLADWNIPNFNRKYIFIPGPCSIATVDGRNPANHLGCIKPGKYWDKLPSSTGAGFVPPTEFTSQMGESREYLP